MVASARTCSSKPHCVYVLKHVDSGEVVYVGVTTRLRARIANHISFAKSFGDGAPPISRWIRNGHAFSVHVVASDLNINCAYKVEAILTKRLRSDGFALVQTILARRAQRHSCSCCKKILSVDASTLVAESSFAFERQYTHNKSVVA